MENTTDINLRNQLADIKSLATEFGLDEKIVADAINSKGRETAFDGIVKMAKDLFEDIFKRATERPDCITKSQLIGGLMFEEKAEIPGFGLFKFVRIAPELEDGGKIKLEFELYGEVIDEISINTGWEFINQPIKQ